MAVSFVANDWFADRRSVDRAERVISRTSDRHGAPGGGAGNALFVTGVDGSNTQWLQKLKDVETARWLAEGTPGRP
jgi:hypothetical protein